MGSFYDVSARLTDKEKRCPKCDSFMRLLDGRDRTVPNGIWLVMRCPSCGLVKDIYKPMKQE